VAMKNQLVNTNDAARDFVVNKCQSLVIGKVENLVGNRYSFPGIMAIKVPNVYGDEVKF
jgi:hypothetical protein